MGVNIEILAQHGVTGDSNALNRLIADANAEIEIRYGKTAGEVTEEYETSGGLIWLKRQAYSIASVAHGPTYKPTLYQTLTEDADDGFQILSSRRGIARLGGGDFFRYARVTYRPIDDEARRDMVIIELVKLALRYNSGVGAAGMLISRTIGKMSESYANTASTSTSYNNEREQLMSRLAAGQRMMA